MDLTSDIYLVEKNRYGAVVIYGTLGVRQYYDYSEKEAKKMYIDEVKRICIRNKS